MDVILTFNARQQVDKGGPLSIAIKQAATLLEADKLPTGAAQLTRDEALEESLLDEEDQEDDDEDEDDDDDDDDDEESDGEVNIWVIAVAGRNVYFAQPTDDQPARLILRAV